MSQLWNPSDLERPLRMHGRQSVWLVRHADLFADNLPPLRIAAAFGVMASVPERTFFLRTRRSDAMVRWFAWLDRVATTGAHDAESRRRTEFCIGAAYAVLGIDKFPPMAPTPAWPLPNVAIGVRATRQFELDLRLPELLDTPAALRFIDADPMREAMRFRGFARRVCPACHHAAWASGPDAGPRWEEGALCPRCGRRETPTVRAVRWLRLCGESKVGAPPFDLAWARDALAEASRFGVMTCLARLGSNPITTPGPLTWPTSDPRGEDMEEWPDDLRVRDRPWPPFAHHPLDTNGWTGWPLTHCQDLDAAATAGDARDAATPDALEAGSTP